MLGVRRRGFSGTIAPVTAAVLTALGQTPTLTGTNPTLEDWQLEVGHYLPAYMAPSIVHPRPANETNAYAVSRMWPSLTPWVIPIGVQGGAWPFKYEIVDAGGMAGLTIGETLDYANWNTTFRLGEYGVLRCNSPAVGTYTITVRVTDQEGTVVERTFTVNIYNREDTTRFYWVDANNGNDSTGTGAYSTPYRTHAGWYGTSGTDTKSQNKQIHFRAGTYPLTDITLDSSVVFTCRVQKSQVLWGVEGESVVFDGGNQGYLRFSSSSLGDCAVGNIQFTNMRSAEFDGITPTKGMGINFQGATAEDRAVVFRNVFDGDIGDTAVGSNTACIFFGDATSDHGVYAYVGQNEFSSLKNMMHVLTYGVTDMLIEGNYSTGTHGPGTGGDKSRGFFLKGVQHARVTVRANDHFDQPTPLFHTSEFTLHRKEDIEVVWNRAYCPTATDIGLGVALIGPGGGTTSTDYGSFWMGRNSFRTDKVLLQNLGTGPTNGPFVMENNAIQCGASHVAGGGFQQISIGGALITISGTECVASSGVFDSNLNLTGSYRTNYLGLRGCEIA